MRILPMSQNIGNSTATPPTDLDTRYPALSALARENHYTLNDLGKSYDLIISHYLGLRECCFEVLNNFPRWAGCDCYNYLATIDEFIRKLPITDRSACKKFWKKLISNGASLIDTMPEITGYLYFLERNIPVAYEEPFDPSNPGSKDADIVITINGNRYWLDVLNVNFESVGFSLPTAQNPFARSPTDQELADVLIKRIKAKYDKKFRNALTSGPLQGCSVGIMLCVFKEEKYLLHQFINPQFLPTLDLFGDENPGLDIVWIYALRSNQNSDILRPVPILQLVRPQS